MQSIIVALQRAEVRLQRSLQVSNGLLQVGAGVMSCCNGPLQPGAGVMSACNDENIARHAPLQRNNEAGLFCNEAHWVSHASWLPEDAPLLGCGGSALHF